MTPDPRPSGAAFEFLPRLYNTCRTSREVSRTRRAFSFPFSASLRLPFLHLLCHLSFFHYGHPFLPLTVPSSVAIHRHHCQCLHERGGRSQSPAFLSDLQLWSGSLASP